MELSQEQRIAAVAVDFCIISDRTKFIQAFVGVGLAPDAGWGYSVRKSYWHVSSYSFGNDG